MAEVNPTIEDDFPTANAPLVELHLGRISSGEVKTGFVEFAPADDNPPLGRLVEFVLGLPEDHQDGVVLWIREIPDIPEDLKKEDIVLADGQVVIDRIKQQVTIGDTTTGVHPKTLQLLELLAENKGRVVSNGEILQGCWGTLDMCEGIVRQNIAVARKALGQYRGLIRNKFEVGYILDDREKPKS